jgi:hypothetical protein
VSAARTPIWRQMVADAVMSQPPDVKETILARLVARWPELVIDSSPDLAARLGLPNPIGVP